MNLKVTGEFIARCRRELGLTQRELADKIGVTDKAVSRWETGKNYPDIELLEAIAKALGVTVSELICGEKIPKEEIVEKSESNTINSLKENKRSKKKFLSVIAVLLVIVIALGSWQGIALFKQSRDVKHHEFYCYDKSVASVLSEVNSYITSLNSAKGDFLVDLDGAFNLVVSDGKAEFLYFEGYTKENGRTFYVSIIGDDKEIGRMKIFIGEYKRYKRSSNNTIKLSDFIPFTSAVDFNSVIPDDVRRTGAGLLVNLYIEKRDGINIDEGKSYLVKNGQCVKTDGKSLTADEYAVFDIFVNGGGSVSNVYYELNK